MGIGLKFWTFLLCASLCLFLAGGGAYSQAADFTKQVTLTVPHPPAVNEALRLKVSVGALPPGANIIVRTQDGKIAGTVSPFGSTARLSGGVYTIPLSEDAVQDGEVSLVLQLEQGGKVRAPSEEEFLGIELYYIPITPFN
ncbi:MAG: hypothetical protein AB4372_06305 [Xenococcus sp. (in: cyanobacteria)]